MINQPSSKTMMLFSGSSNINLAQDVAKKIGHKTNPNRKQNIC